MLVLEGPRRVKAGAAQEEDCLQESHGMIGYPQSWCARCCGHTLPGDPSPRPVQRSWGRPEEILLQPRTRVAAAEPVTWNPQVTPLSQVSPDAVWVHLLAGTSRSQLIELVNHCPGLALVQVPPAMKSLFNLTLLGLYQRLGIGAQLARLRQPRH